MSRSRERIGEKTEKLKSTKPKRTKKVRILSPEDMERADLLPGEILPEEVEQTAQEEKDETKKPSNNTAEDVKGFLPAHEETIPDRSLKEAQEALEFARKNNRPQEEIDKWEQVCRNLYREQKPQRKTKPERSSKRPILLDPPIDSVDESLRKMAERIAEDIPVVENKENQSTTEETEPETIIKTETETGAKSEKLTWEEAIDLWIKEKIGREMDKVEKKLEKGKERYSYEDIYGQAIDNLKEKFKKTIPYAFRNFAVHNVAWSNQETDLDGKVCLGLLGLAGWNDTKKGSISYINPNERSKNKIHMDVGQYNGVGILREVENELQVLDLDDKEAIKLERKDKNPLFNMGMIIDHHPDGAPSAAGMVFKLLDKLRMFENNKRIKRNDIEAIPRMIEFIDLIDSQGYQEIGKPENWNKSDKTILGLHRFMDFPELLKFFREDSGYNRELTEEELKKYNLIGEIEENGKMRKINRQEQQRKVIEVSKDKLKEFEQKGFIIETKLGKTVIDVKGELPGGAFAAQSVGASYFKWDTTGKSFFIFSDKELDKSLFDVGLRIREHLWIVPRTDANEKLNLKDILDRIDAKILPGSELEKYISGADKEKEVSETTVAGEIKVEIKTEAEENILQKIERKNKEIEQAEQRMAIYRPLGWFRKKPVVRDLGYYGINSELERLKGELKELQKQRQQELRLGNRKKVEAKKENINPVDPEVMRKIADKIKTDIIVSGSVETKKTEQEIETPKESIKFAELSEEDIKQALYDGGVILGNSNREEAAPPYRLKEKKNRKGFLNRLFSGLFKREQLSSKELETKILKKMKPIDVKKRKF